MRVSVVVKSQRSWTLFSAFDSSSCDGAVDTSTTAPGISLADSNPEYWEPSMEPIGSLYQSLVWPGWASNPQPPSLMATLYHWTTELVGGITGWISSLLLAEVCSFLPAQRRRGGVSWSRSGSHCFLGAGRNRKTTIVSTLRHSKGVVVRASRWLILHTHQEGFSWIRGRKSHTGLHVKETFLRNVKFCFAAKQTTMFNVVSC